MSFPPYEAYENSAIDCLGEVPAGWVVVPIKRVASIFYGIGEPPQYRPEGIPLIRATNVERGRLLAAGLVFVDPADIPERRIVWLKPGDIIVVRSGAYTGDSAVIPEGYGHCIAGFDMVLRCTLAEPNFVQFALLSAYMRQGQIDLMRMRAAQPHLNAEELGAARIALPASRDEQQAISRFLNRETAKIDALVAEQQNLIALLKEKRQALISHAVTKGLNPDVPMKDSGVAWLGEVPAHWDVAPIKYLVKFRSGGTPSKDRLDYWDGEIPWASAKDMKADRLCDTGDHISDTAIEEGGASLLDEGNVLIVVRGMILARTFPVALTGAPMAINQDLKGLQPASKMSSEFLAWYLRGTAAESLSRLDEAGHGTKALRMDAWASMEPESVFA